MSSLFADDAVGVISRFSCAKLDRQGIVDVLGNSTAANTAQAFFPGEVMVSGSAVLAIMQQTYVDGQNHIVNIPHKLVVVAVNEAGTQINNYYELEPPGVVPVQANSSAMLDVLHRVVNATEHLDAQAFGDELSDDLLYLGLPNGANPQEPSLNKTGLVAQQAAFFATESAQRIIKKPYAYATCDWVVYPLTSVSLLKEGGANLVQDVTIARIKTFSGKNLIYEWYNFFSVIVD